jgi:recombinational DNA repair protein (RecF pathway)
VYDLLNRVLHYLDTDANIKEMPQLVSTFLWRLLTISGFKAELDQCINCRDKVHSGMFSFEGGGMLCPNCKNRDALGVDVSENLLIKLQKSDLQEKAAQSIATRFWKRIVDHNILHSLNFFEILHNYETQR